MQGLLQDKVAVISGAGSGVGRAAVLFFTRQGAKVIAADIDIANAQATADMARAEGGEARAIACDVANRASVEASVDGTVYLLERASDGARASVKVMGRATRGVSVVAGTAEVVSVIGTGVVLSAAGEVRAFVPNAVGRAVLHNDGVS